MAAHLFRSQAERARGAREEAALQQRVANLERDLALERAGRERAEAASAVRAERAARELEELRSAAFGDKGLLQAKVWGLWARLLEARRAAKASSRLSEALGLEEARVRALEAELGRRDAGLRLQEAAAAAAAGEVRALQHALTGALADLKALRADYLALAMRPSLAAGVQCDLGREHAEIWAGSVDANGQSPQHVTVS